MAVSISNSDAKSLPPLQQDVIKVRTRQPPLPCGRADARLETEAQGDNGVKRTALAEKTNSASSEKLKKPTDAGQQLGTTAAVSIELRNKQPPACLQHDAGSLEWARHQRALAKAARALAIQQAEEVYARAMAEIDEVVSARAMCLLCCDLPADVVLGACLHRVCTACLSRLAGRCPWVCMTLASLPAPRILIFFIASNRTAK